MQLTERNFDVLILGAGIAGFSAAERLSQSGLSIGLVDSERKLPYKRTKISKRIAEGFDPEEFALRPISWYEENNISLITGETVVSLDVGSKEATTDVGRSMGFSRLLIATGGRPRALSIAPAVSERQLLVHSQTDVELLRSTARESERILVIGGGVLGTEVAEQLVTAGHQVTIVCSEDTLMQRHLNESASRLLLDLFRSAGAKVALGEQIETMDAAEEGVAVILSGVSQTFARVVTCVGIDPFVDVAARAGVRVNRGVLVDDQLRCGIDGIWAAGDVAEHPGGVITHLWHAAEHQGRVAADNILGAGRTDGLPMFRLKCEVFGHYFFSLNPIALHTVSAEERSGNRYRELLFDSGKLCGAVMVDDGDRAKLYEKAVREGWGREKIDSDLSLGINPR